MRVCVCCCWGSVSEWQPWVLSKTRHRVSCSEQLWRNSNTAIQPLACAPEHCVYICNLTYPLGSQRTPTTTASPNPTPSPLFLSLCHHHHVLCCSHSLLALILSLLLAQSPSSSRHSLFPLTQRYSQANTPTHFLTLTPIHKHTEGLEDTPMCEDHTALMCHSH